MQCLDAGRKSRTRVSGSSGPATPPASFTVCVPGPPCSADRPSLRSCSLLSDEKALDTRGLAPCSPATLLEGLHPGPSPERWHFCVLTLPRATNPLAHHLWSVSGLSNGLVAFPLRDPKGSSKLPHPHLHPSLYCRCLSLGDWPCSLYKPRSIVDSLSPSLSTSHSQVLMILPT